MSNNPRIVGVGSLLRLAKIHQLDENDMATQSPNNNTNNTETAAPDAEPSGQNDSSNQTFNSTLGSPALEGDIATGFAFANEQRGRLLYVPETNEWFLFESDRGWVVTTPFEVDMSAKMVVNNLLRNAMAELIAQPDRSGVSKKLSLARKASSLNSMRAMIEMAKSEPGMSCSISEFDADPMLLGVQNGILDLKKGHLNLPMVGLKVSKRCAVEFDPDAECPRFRQFIEEILAESEVRLALQCWFGYCLTGRSIEKKFLMLIGVGDNGKSILIEVMNWLLGTYASKIDTEMLMNHVRSPQGASPDIVALKGMRLVYANETSEGQRLSDARVKDLTGGDTLTGRVPYGKSATTFEPTHKLMLIGNHKPVITDTSSGMWNRVVLIPFEKVIPKEQRDRHLLAKLKQEGPGILNWLLDGLSHYLKYGLDIPASLEVATAAYREDQDILGEWVNEHCNLDLQYRCKCTFAYKAFQRWCRDNGHGQPSKTTFTRRLGGLQIKQSSCRKFYVGFELNASGSSAATLE